MELDGRLYEAQAALSAAIRNVLMTVKTAVSSNKKSIGAYA